MSQLRSFLFLLIIIWSNDTYGQNNYDVKYLGKEVTKQCRECRAVRAKAPEEVLFSIQKDTYDNLYFTSTSKEWFDKMINKNGDGIAIDIVSREKYNCSKKRPDRKSLIRGELQEPVYLKELKQSIVSTENGGIVIKMGVVPDKYYDKDVEFRVVFIKNKYICATQTTFNLETYRWDLLDMGFYFDTLTYTTAFDTSLTIQESYILHNKVMKFEIPFEKGKSQYSPEDIKPLYDSLNLTDFNINKITIRAYSSVEGNVERNKQLQKERAQSIVTALQSYQTPSITEEITVSENWVDFLNDITFTSYSYMASMSKDEIREKLRDKTIESNMEPYLQKHRKAVIILNLQKKSKYERSSINTLINLFSESISSKNLEQAIEIQNSIFDKVRNHEVPTSYLNKLEIPEKSEFSLLLNRNSIFKYLMNEIDVFDAYKELTELMDLMPNDGHLKYNICVLKFKLWLLASSGIDPVDFRIEITDLKKWGIPNELIKRMLINYEILMGEHYMAQGDFVNKDKALKFIYSNYKLVPLSDTDYLSLAQYFASYLKLDWAAKLLEKKVRSVDVSEDLLFYYLNLTIAKDNLINRADYRTVMLNALNINPTRFCKMFDCYWNGGVTFQLLENDYLRKTYCENCDK